jgi:hypothetical protein
MTGTLVDLLISAVHRIGREMYQTAAYVLCPYRDGGAPARAARH